MSDNVVSSYAIKNVQITKDILKFYISVAIWTRTLVKLVCKIINMKQILLFLLLISYACGAEVRVDPLVLISNQGLVRGHKATDGDYSIFLGIPYARVNIDNPFGVST